MYLHEIESNMPQDIREQIKEIDHKPTVNNSLRLHFHNGYGISIQWGQDTASDGDAIPDSLFDMMFSALVGPLGEQQSLREAESAECALLLNGEYDWDLNKDGNELHIYPYQSPDDILALCRHTMNLPTLVKES